jgi:hypothetical protein
MEKRSFLWRFISIALICGMTVIGCFLPEPEEDDDDEGPSKGPTEQVVKPTADPDGGSVLSGQKITLTSTTADATIYYTLDGTTPTTSSTPYSTMPEITSSCTLKAIATKSGMTNSEVLSVSYTAVAMPAFSSVTSTIELFEYEITAVAYGNNRFVTGGYGDQIAYSTNGTTWIASTGNDMIPRGIIYNSSSQFVAVGEVGVGAISYLSNNGTIWTPIATVNTTFAGNGAIHDVAYGGGRYVAVGVIGKMATSTNGTTWTAVTNSTFGTSSIYGITYGDKFVAVGADGKIAYSINGTNNWTAVTNADSTTINGITYGGAIGKEKYIAVGSGTYIAYSTDGLTWTKVNSGYNDIELKRIAWGGNKYVAVASSGVMLVSLDGINWAKIEGGIGTGKSQMTHINDIAYGGGKFLVVGYYEDTHWNFGDMAISN